VCRTLNGACEPLLPVGAGWLCSGTLAGPMEAFEQFVAVYLEQHDYVVSSAVKFPFSRQTRRVDHVEVQTHGYEVDIVGARADRLVLATVKSFLGSRGVVADHVDGTSERTAATKRYALLNDVELRSSVVRQAAKRYGYSVRQVELRLFVGRFAGPTKGEHERRVREWCRSQRSGAGSIKVYSLADTVDTVVSAAVAGKQYRDNPVLVTMKLLQAAGLLQSGLPEIQTEDDADSE
jgi:hypothetical protein